MDRSYVAKDSAAGGYTVDLLETGTKTKEEMFQNAENANTMMTWILRVVGWLMMYMGPQGQYARRNPPPRANSSPGRQ